MLDVGCGPGALTAELVGRVGAAAVAAVDPSESFAVAAQARNPGADVRHATAEDLPFPDQSFDAALAQLVVSFMADPVAGVMEMRRVTTPGGVVAASVWDLAEGPSPLSPLWDAVRSLDPGHKGESERPGGRQGDLATLFDAAGLLDVEEVAQTVQVEHPTFEEWWEPFTLGVGPAGEHVAGLDAESREQLRERCRSMLPEPPFVLSARAWTARGRA